MAGQVIFLKKSVCDFENTNVTLSATTGNDVVANILNRSNRNAWISSGSTDLITETLLINLGDVRRIDTIILAKHNFKRFNIYYWNDDTLAYVLLQAETTCTASTSYYTFTAVNTSRILIDNLTLTQTANAEKYLYQLIATESIGQLAGWPVFKNPTLSREGRANKMLSGKLNYQVSVGAYSASLEVANWSSSADLTIVEALYDSNEGFLFWPCGGIETQFSSVRKGFRLEDIYLCRCKNEYQPEWVAGLYKSGMKIKIDLVEVNS